MKLLHALSLLQSALLVKGSSIRSIANTTAVELPWNGWGGNTFNNRWASTNTAISSCNIKTISSHCKIAYPGGISATTTIVSGIAYYTTWNGSLVALDYASCTVKWQTNIADAIITFGGPPTALQAPIVQAVSRTSPQVDLANNLIYIGTGLHALVIAADLATGAILGSTQIHAHPLAQITQSGTVHNGVFYIGTSSAEESANSGSDPSYVCCTFVGNAVAVRFTRATNTFSTLWDIPMLVVDDSADSTAGTGDQWSGIAVWGSQPAIDVARNTVYYATGNTYSVPDAWLACTATPLDPACELPERVWQESVLALDLDTGAPRWVRRLGALDVYTVACSTEPKDPALCDFTTGEDADFGMAPTFVPAGGKDGGDAVVVGQKNGNLYSLNADSGAIEWVTSVGPGGTTGGLSWGIAVDNGRVYFSENNSEGKEWRPQPQNDTVINNSAYGAASLSTGELLWETPANATWSSTNPPTVVGNLVLSLRQQAATLGGGFVVLKKTTGEILLDMDLDAYSQSSIAVAGKYIFLGTGYHGYLDGFLHVFSVA
ncbi:quinon protein alcohol dehydrogenase-like superfamily [Bombardia bombarda]|uniref:Quinon protein alcohol dehydrogenase-like superfamily n=1 Tax=Bombardia bombarda TaxID=252184 RepID=A0AA39WHB7_9PEZI|nr:quinon protein alcohol dehydrogenase-like superfamily [Bombardia bombarda]